MLKRFGVSLEENLLDKFDDLLMQEGYKNRSEAIRDLIREALIKREWEEEDTETAGTAILVYDHHQHDLAQKITDIQHKSHNLIISSMHAHLDHDNCLEVILLKGRAKKIKKLASSLISTKGVKHGQFVNSTTGRRI